MEGFQMHAKHLGTLAASFTLPLLVAAQGADIPHSCLVKDASTSIRVLICPTGLDTTALQDAGVAACADSELCLAWIWNDAAKAPDVAPVVSDQLTQDQVTAARAVWDHDAKTLITIAEEPKPK